MAFQIENSILKKYEGDDEFVIIPDGITGIGDYAFYGALHMKGVQIPDTVREMGSNVFYNCESLEEAVIPDSVTYAGSAMFARCASLKRAVLSDGLTALPKITFFCCEKLEEVILPKKLRQLNRACFEQCHSLQEVNLPDTVRDIGENAFDDCVSLKRITLPASLVSIGDNAFFNCRKLRKLVLPASLTSIGKGAFETRGPVSVQAEAVHLRSVMFDNNWNMNWNFGANRRYNGRNEENYQFFDSYMPDVDLKEWKPEAACTLCINYLETYKDPSAMYDAWIREHEQMCLERMLEGKRYKALLESVRLDLVNADSIQPHLDRITDPSVRAELMNERREQTSSFDDLFDML